MDQKNMWAAGETKAFLNESLECGKVLNDLRFNEIMTIISSADNLFVAFYFYKMTSVSYKI